MNSQTEETNKIIEEIKEFLRENDLTIFETNDDLIAEFLKLVN